MFQKSNLTPVELLLISFRRYYFLYIVIIKIILLCENNIDNLKTLT